MSYPRNASTPPVIDVGAIYQISDSVIQTSGASARVKTGNAGAWAPAAGTLACDATSGIWTYIPTQAETNADSFVIALYKTGCTSIPKTVVTSVSATAGYAGLDWANIANKTTTNALTATTISSSQVVASVTATVDANVIEVGGEAIDGTPGVPDVNVISIDPDAIDAASIAADAVTKIQVGLATSTQVTSLLANTRANITGPLEIEVPDSSTNTALFRIYLMDSDGAMEAPDSTPTITLTNAASTSRASRLAAATNPATGVYEWVYTNTAGDTQETLYGEITVTEGGIPRKYPFQTQLVEFSAYRFSSTDRAALASLEASASTTLSTLTAVQSGLSVISGNVSDCETGIGTAITNIGSLSTYVAVIRAFLLNKHSAATESPTGTFTWYVRNETDSANAYQVVYVKATGARTVTIL